MAKAIEEATVDKKKYIAFWNTAEDLSSVRNYTERLNTATWELTVCCFIIINEFWDILTDWSRYMSLRRLISR